MVYHLATILTKGKREHASDEELVGTEGRKAIEVLGYEDPEIITEQPVLENARKHDDENLGADLGETSSDENVVCCMPKFVNNPWSVFTDYFMDCIFICFYLQ